MTGKEIVLAVLASTPFQPAPAHLWLLMQHGRSEWHLKNTTGFGEDGHSYMLK